MLHKVVDLYLHVHLELVHHFLKHWVVASIWQLEWAGDLRLVPSASARGQRLRKAAISFVKAILD